MTYLEIIERAIFDATDHAKVPVERLRMQAQAIFPSIVEELAQAVAMNIDHPWREILLPLALATNDRLEAHCFEDVLFT